MLFKPVLLSHCELAAAFFKKGGRCEPPLCRRVDCSCGFSIERPAIIIAD
jgi:hypothetical protein